MRHQKIFVHPKVFRHVREATRRAMRFDFSGREGECLWLLREEPAALEIPFAFVRCKENIFCGGEKKAFSLQLSECGNFMRWIIDIHVRHDLISFHRWTNSSVTRRLTNLRRGGRFKATWERPLRSPPDPLRLLNGGKLYGARLKRFSEDVNPAKSRRAEGISVNLERKPQEPLKCESISSN